VGKVEREAGAWILKMNKQKKKQEKNDELPSQQHWTKSGIVQLKMFYLPSER